MNGRLAPYPALKSSSTPWLEQIPAGWDDQPGRSLFRGKEVKNSDLAATQILSLSYGRIVVKPDDATGGLSPASYDTYQVVEPGDVIVRSTDLQNDQTSLRVGLVRDRGAITSAYLCLASTGRVLPDFGYLLLHAYDVRKVLYGLGSGLRQNLSFSDFKNLLFPVPPPEEQAAIVRFVAWADDRLARYVQAKRRLIELLEEQKQIIIAQALSRGVRHDAVVAPSGIDWLGHVPTAWEITPLGRLIDLATGFPFKSEGFTEDENDVRLLRGINVAPGRIRWEGVVRWPSADAPTYVGFELKEGDLVLGMDRPVVAAGVRVARVGPSDVPSLLLQRVARIRAHERLDSDFLLLLLSGRAFAHYLAPIFTGVSVPHISPAQIRRFKIALPTVPEQREIVKTVRAETDALDVAASVARREIALLREYRTRLLADVVTGKVDVREAAAHLPDKAGDLEMPTEFDAVNGDQGIADSTQAPALEDAAA